MRGPYGPPKEALFLLASRAARHMSGSTGRDSRSATSKRGRGQIAASFAEGKSRVVGSPAHGLELEVAFVQPRNLADHGVVLALRESQDVILEDISSRDRLSPALSDDDILTLTQSE